MACESGEVQEEGMAWLAGVACAVASSTCIAFGNIYQKLAQEEQKALPEGLKYPEPVPGLVMSRKWFTGLSLVGLFPLPLDALAFSLAAQSLITPVGGVTLVMTQIIGPQLLEGEIVTRSDYLAGLVIVTGVVLTSAFGVHSGSSYTVEDLKALWQAPDAIGMAIFAWASIAAALSLVHRARDRLGNMEPMVYAYIAGALGAQMNILFKGVAELIKGAVQTDHNSFTEAPFSALLWVVGTIALAVVQISYINQALQLFDCVLFAPLYSASLILCGVTFGGIYYQEFGCLDAFGWAMFFFGLSVTLAGIFLLLRSKRNPRHAKPLALDEDESQSIGMETLQTI